MLNIMYNVLRLKRVGIHQLGSRIEKRAIAITVTHFNREPKMGALNRKKEKTCSLEEAGMKTEMC